MERTKTHKGYLPFTMATTLGVAAVFGIIAACTNSAKAKINIVHKAPEKPGVVAKVGDQELTMAQLIADKQLEAYENQKRAYEFNMEQLKAVATEIMVGAEAKKAGMSTQDYIDKKIAGNIKVADSDYKKFISERHWPEAQITPDIRAKIMDFLKNMKKQDLVQEHMARLTKSAPIIAYFEKPLPPRINVDPGSGPMYGGKNAKVTIVEFSDFQCPYCGRAADTVRQVEKKYGNKIKLVFRQFPLPMHPDAKPAAEASMCLNEQGTDKFWKFHDIAFKNQQKLDSASLEKYAKDVGADVGKFKECVASHKFADYVQKDIAYGESVKVQSTPTFFINGQIVNGAVPVENFSEIIDSELEGAKS